MNRPDWMTGVAEPLPGSVSYQPPGVFAATRPNSCTDGDQSGQLILFDPDGDGVQLSELSRSTMFMDATGDGLANRTAWAAAGNGVLFYDPDNIGAINEKRQYVFTEWDGSATSDMEALRAVFDSNGDEVLDTEFANFGPKVLISTSNIQSIVSRVN